MFHHFRQRKSIGSDYRASKIACLDDNQRRYVAFGWMNESTGAGENSTKERILVWDLFSEIAGNGDARLAHPVRRLSTDNDKRGILMPLPQFPESRDDNRAPFGIEISRYKRKLLGPVVLVAGRHLDLAKIAHNVNTRHIQLVMIDSALRAPGIAEANTLRVTEPICLSLFDPLQIRRLEYLPPMVNVDIIA